MKYDIARNLGFQLKKNNLSVIKFSEKVNVERQTVYGWLKGRNMSVDSLISAAKELKCRPSELLEGENPVDIDLLSKALCVVEKALGKKKTDPEKRAKLISYVYEKYSAGQDLDSAEVEKIVMFM